MDNISDHYVELLSCNFERFDNHESNMLVNESNRSIVKLI